MRVMIMGIVALAFLAACTDGVFLGKDHIDFEAH